MIGNNKVFFTPETWIDAAAQGVEMCDKNVRHQFPDTQIIVTDILPAHTPGSRFYEDITKVNAALADFKLSNLYQVHELRLWESFTNPDGTFKSGLFSRDSIHLTQQAGYAVYSNKLKPLLEVCLKE